MSQTQSDKNLVILTGYLEAAPTQRELPGGLPVANAKLISQSRFLSTDQVRAINAIPLAFYGPAAAWAASLRARDQVLIEGELVLRSTSMISQRITTEVVVRFLRQLAVQVNADDAADTETWG